MSQYVHTEYFSQFNININYIIGITWYILFYFIGLHLSVWHHDPLRSTFTSGTSPSSWKFWVSKMARRRASWFPLFHRLMVSIYIVLITYLLQCIHSSVFIPATFSLANNTFNCWKSKAVPQQLDLGTLYISKNEASSTCNSLSDWFTSKQLIKHIF
jgi:hypothetical protein